MATTSYADQLESVQSAIAAIEGGEQAFVINGRTVTRGDLRTLYDREKWLRKMAARSERGGIRSRRIVPHD